MNFGRSLLRISLPFSFADGGMMYKSEMNDLIHDYSHPTTDAELNRTQRNPQ